MCYRDGNHGAVKSLLSWLLGLCPAPATSSITAQWQRLLALLLPRKQPIRGDAECSALANTLPTLLVLSGCSKSQRRPLVFGICLGDVCVHVSVQSFLSKACCCWAHRCFFQRRVSVETSWEKEGSQVHVLEAHWVWVAPRCPLNKITAFTRPLLFLCECNTINKRGGRFFFFFSLGKKTQFRYVGTFFSKPTHTPIQSLHGPQRRMKGKFISERILLIIFPFYVDESPCKAW